MSSQWRYSVVTLAALIVLSGTASAQICGDADDNGQVSVTDGVQALRAAATLPSSCTAERCDVDGNGSISVTDGVNILRKAAELPITENCPGSLDAQVEELLNETLPIFGALTKVSTSAQIAETFPCENEGGTISFDEETGDIEFFECQLDTFLYNGTLSDDPSGLFFDIAVVDLETDEFFSLFGDVAFRTTPSGGVIDGSLDVSFDDIGEIAVVFEEVETDVDGNFVGGSLLFDATDSGIEGVVGIRVGFAPSPIVPVAVIFDDTTTANFDFDTISGDLTPASN